ncbi:ROK family transcriptional regulator [Agromyces intestinalis]|uniref:ROK family transcriptional regulator n=1 Tax=Agromyces intestinalis TaxID=2592652 RepID=A0A5C1YLH6_9MICO|nr:ROK family transcriptional regulator [Agromyces intestinalis]
MVDLIRSSGPISRVELTEITGLTQPSISNIVRRLIADGVVRETDHTVSTGGKPRTLLVMNSRALFAVGIQLGTESAVGIAADSTGGVFGRQRFAGAGTDEPGRVVHRLAQDYRDLVAGLGLDESRIAGLSVVAPGPIDLVRGTLLGPPSLRRWHDFPLREALSDLIEVPVLIDNDSAAAALGEFWSRQVPRGSTYACVYMGAGIGGGIVSEGSLYRGASSNPAELGHISVEIGGRACFCGNRGCLERYAAPPAVVATARDDEALVAELGLDPHDDELAFDTLARAAVQGHPGALALIEASAQLLAEATLTFANLIDIDRITLAGWGFAIAGSIYARAIGDALRARAFARSAHLVQVELSSNPRDSAAVGAAALILQSSLAPGHGPRPARRTDLGMRH